MHRLFLDANVLFTAAHNATGKSAFIIQMAERGHWIVISSKYAIEEARRNLLRKFPSAVKRPDMSLKILKKNIDFIGQLIELSRRTVGEGPADPAGSSGLRSQSSSDR